MSDESSKRHEQLKSAASQRLAELRRKSEYFSTMERSDLVEFYKKVDDLYRNHNTLLSEEEQYDCLAFWQSIRKYCKAHSISLSTRQ